MEFHALIYLFSLWINNSDWAFTRQITITKMMLFSTTAPIQTILQWKLRYSRERVQRRRCSFLAVASGDLGNMFYGPAEPSVMKSNVCYWSCCTLSFSFLIHMWRHTHHAHTLREKVLKFCFKDSCLGSITCNGFLTSVWDSSGWI